MMGAGVHGVGMGFAPCSRAPSIGAPHAATPDRAVRRSDVMQRERPRKAILRQAPWPVKGTLEGRTGWFFPIRPL